MRMYQLDIETLLSLLYEAGQSGRLSTTLPSGIPGFKQYCRASIDLQEGKIVFCQIEQRNGRVLISGKQALQILSRSGTHEWLLEEVQFHQGPTPVLPPATTATTVTTIPNLEKQHGPSVVPQRKTFIDQSTLSRFSRQQRRVLNLVDGKRSVERIAILLSASSDPSAIRQTLQQVEERLRELEALGAIFIGNYK
jgi:hypothetical protein